MVFMGTKKYPDENEWSAFLAKNGGEDNGETNLETTTCYFDVHPDFLGEALPRFASFFACPLFNFGSAAREVKAVDSEFQQAKLEDENRHYQLLCHLSSPGHPYHRFTWGDKRSLEEVPQRNGADMRAALQSFHERYYAAHYTTVVVLGKEPLDQLQQWVSSAFGEMPEKPSPRPSFASHGLPFAGNVVADGANNGGKKKRGRNAAASGGEGASAAAGAHEPPLWVRTVPLKERRRLEINWYVTSLLDAHKSKPEAFIVHVLGHECDGSLLWALQQEGLAYSLCAGIDDDEHTSNSGRFSIQVELTPHGLEEVERVLELIHGGIGHLARSANELGSYYDEINQICKLRFEFAESEPEIDYVRRLAISMQRGFDPDETLSADYLINEYDQKAVNKLLESLTPSTAITTLTHKPSEEDDDAKSKWETEEWFGTRYTSEKVDESRLARWQAAYDGKGTPPSSGAFTLPPPNPFLPTKFQLVNDGVVSDPTRTSRPPPELLLSDQRGQLFHAPDVRFATPKAVCCLQIEIAQQQDASDTKALVEKRVLEEIAAKYIIEAINAETYAATLCGYTYELTTSEHGWHIEVHGFSDKLPPLLVKLCSSLKALADAPQADQTILKRVITAYELKMANANFGAAELATDERLRCLEPKWINGDDRLNALPIVTPSKLSSRMAETLKSGIQLVVYTGGNLNVADAKAIFDSCHDALGSPKPLEPLPPLGRCVQLNPGRASRSAYCRNPTDENCAVDMYWQIGTDDGSKVSGKLALLEHIMYESLFDTLRTKQQLGYSVSCSARNTQGVLGFLISITSHSHSVSDIEERALTFVRTWLSTTLKTMPDAEYTSNVQAAATNRLLADKTIEDEASRYWFELEQRAYCFGRAEAEAAAMRSTSKRELLKWAEECLLSKKARRLVIAVRPRPETGVVAAEVDEKEVADEIVSDPKLFAKALPPHARAMHQMPPVVSSA